MVVLAESLTGYANDFIDDPKIATRARVWAKLAESILEQAHSEGLTDIVNKDDSGYHINEQEFQSLMEFSDEYDELSAHKYLANRLAWRDFQTKYSAVEIATMAEKSGGYLGVKLHSFEEKYLNEFEENEYSRLQIVTEAS